MPPGHQAGCKGLHLSPGTHEIQLFPLQQNLQLLQTSLDARWVGAIDYSEPKRWTPQFKSQSCFPEGEIGMKSVAKRVWGLHRSLMIKHLQRKQLSNCHEISCPGWRPLASQKLSHLVMLDVHVTGVLLMARPGHYGITFFNIVLPDTATGNSLLESLNAQYWIWWVSMCYSHDLGFSPLSGISRDLLFYLLVWGSTAVTMRVRACWCQYMQCICLNETWKKIRNHIICHYACYWIPFL